MRKTIYLLILLAVFGCGNNKKRDFSAQSSIIIEGDKKNIQYSEQQLESFLDSIGNLHSKTLTDKVAFFSDSIFKNQLSFDKTISIADFKVLKQAVKSTKIDYKTAKNIFENFILDSTYIETGTLPISYFSFDKNKNEFNEYAICIGYPDAGRSCELYFFKSNKLISKHTIYHRYGLELNHYKDNDGKTIVYYKENYQSGSGIWWFNFNFYKYYNGKLIPVLNELQNSNMQSPWGFRALWFESGVQSTNPLIIKMVYNQQLPDSTYQDLQLPIISDSTLIEYNWDEASMSLIAQYEKSKLSKPKILSFYLEDNEFLFINTYYTVLKNSLQDKTKKKLTLQYLNEVKNYYRNK